MKKKILIINGPNINMLGIREVDVYGKKTYKDLKKYIKDFTRNKGLKVEIYQSNYEGDIISKIQKAYFKKVDGIIINAGGYTHTSIAILDALKAANIPTVEVHISDISSREEFRKNSYISLYAEEVYKGLGFNSYIKALEYFLRKF